MFLFIPPAIEAQSLSSGSLHGVVVDSLGERIGGANLLLEDERTGFARNSAADREGRFDFSLLPPGEYSLLVEQFGTRPLLLEGLRIRAGEPLEIPVVLARATGAVESADRLRYSGGLLTRAAGVVIPIPREQLLLVPTERREAVEWARHASATTTDLQMEGLPASYSRLWVDGAAVSPLTASLLTSSTLLGAAFPLSSLSGAELIASLADVEWSGVTGGVLNLHSRRGGRETQIDAFGSFSNDALRTGGAGLSGEPYQSIQGGFGASGSLVPDTVAFVVGVEAWRLGSPGERLAANPLDEAALEVARSTYGVELEDRGLGVQQSDVVSAFGRFDWLLSPTSALQVRANFANISRAPGALISASGLSHGESFEGRELFSNVILTTRYSDRVQQEIRFGFDSGERSYATDPSGLSGATRILGSTLSLGSDRLPLSVSRAQSVRASGTLFIQSGAHSWKMGISADIDQHEHAFAPVRNFLFAGAAEFAAGSGYLLENRRDPAAKSYALPRAGLFLQDSWNAALGWHLLAGARLDMERLPRGSAALNQDWLAATGMANNQVSSMQLRVSPRIGMIWDIQERGEWILAGSAGLYSGAIDPGIVGEWIADAAGTSVVRSFGTFPNWPTPTSGELVAPRASLTLLGESYASPRSIRANLGLRRLFRAHTLLSASVRYRGTDLLPRYTDLNLWASGDLTDQYGRLLSGRPVVRSGVLATEPGSNRRFDGFDRVTAIHSDGRSTYLDLTLIAEHRRPDGLGLFATYTASRTEDNGIASGSVLSPGQYLALPSRGSNWAEGRSDFDIPHRATIGLDYQLPAFPGLTLGALYRVRSGEPFTPGFAEGVDANGDGFAGNDPAFIDPALPGMDTLLGRWQCLSSQAGAFAERNSCRTETSHALDAHLGFRLARTEGAAIEIFLDGLNLLGSTPSYPDRALLLIDPNGSIREEGGRLHLPLVVNEGFGESRRALETGRVLRLGVQINY